MNNKLPIEIKKDNIFKRFFNYIKKIFQKTSNVQNIEENQIEKKKTKINELYKIENLEKVNANVIKQINRQNKIEEIIQIIEKEPKILEKLDIPKLEIIDKYYKDKIIEYRKKLSNT